MAQLQGPVLQQAGTSQHYAREGTLAVKASIARYCHGVIAVLLCVVLLRLSLAAMKVKYHPGAKTLLPAQAIQARHLIWHALNCTGVAVTRSPPC